MSNLVADVCNQSLDAAGVDFTIGDITEGTRPAQVLLRAYGQVLRQLLRSANWGFARKTAPMILLADATGNTADVGAQVPVPWVYEYQYPIDCMKARFVPWNQSAQSPSIPQNNIQIPTTPLMTGLGQQPLTGQRIIPARFVEATDFNYPPPAGTVSWDVQGVSPAGRTVILTNVQNAQLVYTALMLYPSVWDALFRSALVAYLASEIVLSLSKDKKLGLAIRNQQIAIVKQKLMEARLVDGNEGFYSADIRVDWMAARNSGGSSNWSGAGSQGGGPGWFYGANDSCGFSDGSAY